MDDNQVTNTEETETPSVTEAAQEVQENVEISLEEGETEQPNQEAQEPTAIHIALDHAPQAEDTWKEKFEKISAEYDAYKAKIESDEIIANWVSKPEEVSTKQFISQYYTEDYTSKVQTDPLAVFMEYKKRKAPFAKPEKLQQAWEKFTEDEDVSGWDGLSLDQQATLMEYAKELGSTKSDPENYHSRAKEIMESQKTKNRESDKSYLENLVGKKIHTDKEGRVGYQVTKEDAQWVDSALEALDNGNLTRSKLRDYFLLAKTSASAVKIAAESYVSNAKNEVLTSVSNSAPQRAQGNNHIPPAVTKNLTDTDALREKAAAVATNLRNPDGTLKT